MSFAERHVSADGFEIRYLEGGEAAAGRDGRDGGQGGQGGPLVCFHGAGGLRLSRAHELLAAGRRVLAFELPGFGESAANERSRSLADLASTMLQAITAIGVDRFDLWGTSFGGRLALWLATAAPARLGALVLAAPAAILTGAPPPQDPAELAAILFHHPERQLPAPPLSPQVAGQQQALVQRLIGPPRDPELEAAMREMNVPTLVLFGTEDRLTPPELGRHYRELLPNCQLVFVYDAAHAIDADRPEAFTALVSDFLEHREQFVVRRRSSLLYP
jgi:pimeloyl-ACP methyl ester carboxylesterase